MHLIRLSCHGVLAWNSQGSRRARRTGPDLTGRGWGAKLIVAGLAPDAFADLEPATLNPT